MACDLLSADDEEIAMPGESTRGHSALRILVAEDDAEMRRIVAEALRKDGYDVREAADGGRLLVAIGADDAADIEIDLIITDVRMPVCSGLRIVEWLRRARRRIPVILMTAFGDEDVQTEATRLGAVLFEKPFAVSALRATVKSVLARSSGATAP